jgi:hypothetical protein
VWWKKTFGILSTSLMKAMFRLASVQLAAGGAWSLVVAVGRAEGLEEVVVVGRAVGLE